MRALLAFWTGCPRAQGTAYEESDTASGYRVAPHAVFYSGYTGRPSATLSTACCFQPETSVPTSSAVTKALFDLAHWFLLLRSQLGSHLFWERCPPLRLSWVCSPMPLLLQQHLSLDCVFMALSLHLDHISFASSPELSPGRAEEVQVNIQGE